MLGLSYSLIKPYNCRVIIFVSGMSKFTDSVIFTVNSDAVCVRKHSRNTMSVSACDRCYYPLGQPRS